MVFRLTKPKYLADGWDFHQTLGPKILWFFSAEGRSLQHVKKHQKNHSFGANFIRKVKHVTKRSSLFTVNYWELLNHNLQKTKQHLLTPAESREKLGTGWASTFNSSCGHGQESRSSAFCDLSRPLRSDEALWTESGRTPQVANLLVCLWSFETMWNALLHCWGSENKPHFENFKSKWKTTTVCLLSMPRVKLFRKVRAEKSNVRLIIMRYI